MKAYVIEGTKAVVKEIPDLVLDPKEVLVQVKSVAINPTDWKHVDFKLGTDGAIVGCDFAGVVTKLGTGVPAGAIAVGDSVFGVVGGSSLTYPHRGAFGEYVAVEYNTVFSTGHNLDYDKSKVSLGPVNTWEGAASVPVGVLTAIMVFGFYNKWGLAKGAGTSDKKFYLVWGGSSAVGSAVVQLARWLGFRVIATASKKNFDLVKSLGAETVFDYHDADVVDEIRKYTNGTLEYAYDTISEGPTLQQVYDAVASATGKGDIANTLPYDPTKEIKGYNPDVKYHFPLGYLALVDKKQFGASGPVLDSPLGLRDSYKKVVAEINQLWGNPELNFRHLPLKVFDNGFDDLDQAMDFVRQGKNSGIKVVVDF